MTKADVEERMDAVQAGRNLMSQQYRSKALSTCPLVQAAFGPLVRDWNFHARFAQTVLDNAGLLRVRVIAHANKEGVLWEKF